MREMVIIQFKKFHDRNEAGETKRLFIEKQLGGLSKVITDQTSGKMEATRQTLGTGERKWQMV